MNTIRSLAPQREEKLPLELYAGDGGCIGLKFNPVYNIFIEPYDEKASDIDDS